MNNKFHEGEYHIQEIMGVRKDSDTLSSMIQNTIPNVASIFLKNLNFCVLALSSKKEDLFTSTIYDLESFIEVLDDSTIVIKLENNSYIPPKFESIESLNIGMIGLDFKHAKRIRINGKGQIKENKLYISIDEIYSNCPKYIKRRILKKEIRKLEKQTLRKEINISNKVETIISKTDTFFISTSHDKKGLDVSHKGGENGFLKVLSSSRIQFEDMPGNNLYNSIGNIHTNPYVNIFIIDYKNNNTYNISGNAKIEEISTSNKKRLIITIECKEIILNENSFSLDYTT